MRNYLILSVLTIASALMLSSCQAVGDVFKAGMWIGVIIVVIVVVLVLWLITKFRK